MSFASQQIDRGGLNGDFLHNRSGLWGMPTLYINYCQSNCYKELLQMEHDFSMWDDDLTQVQSKDDNRHDDNEHDENVSIAHSTSIPTFC
jgi:hypothetical protein